MKLIGVASDLPELPHLFQIDGDPYILTESQGDYKLYSAVCPHKQGTVHPESEDEWVCPDHGWTFDGEGICTNAINESLETFPVTKRDDKLYAHIDETAAGPIKKSGRSDTTPPRITLASHATLLFEYEGFRLLTDPWLIGEAFQGSWTQYPPSPIHPTDIGTVDAIWITHEHSDHLHPPTLAYFDNSTPVYIPEFRCRRLRRRMIELGFSNINVIPSAERVKLTDQVTAVSFDSKSVWNDSLQYLNFGGFEILNANDAGINREVHDVVGTVDLVSSAFSQGASGYPLTWTHLSDAEKRSIIRESNAGQFNKFEELVELFDPAYVLPFASFQALWHPEHQAYLDLQEKNAPADIADHLGEAGVEVLDLYPGEWWDGEGIGRREDRDIWFSGDHRERYLRRYTNELPIPDPYDHALDHEHLSRYFQELSGSRHAEEAGDLAVSFTANGGSGGPDLHAVLRFEDGQITYRPISEPKEVDVLSARCNIRMQCPAGHVQRVIEQDLSWDEITTGYWGTRSRQPDDYNLGFWKLLCVPWEARRDSGATRDAVEQISTDSPVANRAIAELVEEDLENVSQVLQRHGLHCVGCEASVGENIVEGCLNHGLSEPHVDEVVTELEAVLN